MVERSASKTIFTRFIPPQTPDDARGAWQEYYRRWSGMTRQNLDPCLLELVPALDRWVPPASVFDKTVYSPWMGGALHRHLQASGTTTLILTGGETDVCILATLMGAMDLGYRVVLPADGIFGSADSTHDAMLAVYQSRFQVQLTVTDIATILDQLPELGSD